MATIYTFATRPNGPRHVGGILYIPGVPTINAPANRQQETVDGFLERLNHSRVDWHSKASRGLFAGLANPVHPANVRRSPRVVLPGVGGGRYILPESAWVGADNDGRGHMGTVLAGRNYITAANLGQALVAAFAVTPAGAAPSLAAPLALHLAGPPANPLLAPLLPLAAPVFPAAAILPAAVLPGPLPFGRAVLQADPDPAPLHALSPFRNLFGPPIFCLPLAGPLIFMAPLEPLFFAVFDHSLEEDDEDDDEDE